MVLICPKCGKENHDNAEFCQECGTNLSLDMTEKKEKISSIGHTSDDTKTRKNNFSGRILGFRTRTPWKMVLASSVCIIIIITVLLILNSQLLIFGYATHQDNEITFKYPQGWEKKDINQTTPAIYATNVNPDNSYGVTGVFYGNIIPKPVMFVAFPYNGQFKNIVSYYDTSSDTELIVTQPEVGTVPYYYKDGLGINFTDSSGQPKTLLTYSKSKYLLILITPQKDYEKSNKTLDLIADTFKVN